MPWTIRFCDEFVRDFKALDERVQVRMLGYLQLLQFSGPALGRPQVDTLKGSRYPNMKELRFPDRNEVWRVAFAFDPGRQAVILVAGNKAGVSQHRFYQGLIRLRMLGLIAIWQEERTMSKTLDEVINELSPERREQVRRLGRQLIREELSLQALRKQLEITQEGLAERLDIRQGNVSKVEKRSDMLISTLRNYIEAMGGTLELVAHMPGRAPVTLEGFADENTPRPSARTLA